MLYGIIKTVNTAAHIDSALPIIKKNAEPGGKHRHKEVTIMTKIINGAKYSTETARHVASWENDINCSNFAYCSEDLYRTKSGKYFLHGAGGAMSRYAEHRAGGDIVSGECILPMSEDQARVWADEHVSGDTYELIFGAVSEDAELSPMTFQISPETREKLDSLKLSTGLNLSTLISAAINAYVGKQ